MNVYHRLLNILAEQLQPEYWTIDELINCLDLAQREFARDSRLFKKTKGLVPSFRQNEPVSQMPVTILTVLDKGQYQLPDDCMEVRKVYWQGKLLEKANIDFINARYAGNSHFHNLKGIGRHYEIPLPDVEGEPHSWFYDNGIRIVPSGMDDIEFCFNTLTEYDMNLDEDVELETNDLCNEFKDMVIRSKGRVDSETYIYMQFAQKIKTVDGKDYYRDGQWEKLKYDRDYFVSTEDGSFVVFFSDEYIHKIKCVYCHKKILPTILFINPSHNATIEYIPVPNLSWDIKTIETKGVCLEIPELHHEAIACYAAFLALSKEGKKTQDLDKAQIYLQRYQAYLANVAKTKKGSVNVDYKTILPFRI